MSQYIAKINLIQLIILRFLWNKEGEVGVGAEADLQMKPHHQRAPSSPPATPPPVHSLPA